MAHNGHEHFGNGKLRPSQDADPLSKEHLLLLMQSCSEIMLTTGNLLTTVSERMDAIERRMADLKGRP